jgi:hypothetical protein
MSYVLTGPAIKHNHHYGLLQNFTRNSLLIGPRGLGGLKAMNRPFIVTYRGGYPYRMKTDAVPTFLI